MRTVFKNSGTASDCSCFIDDKNEDRIHALTLGSSSYINGVTLEINLSDPPLVPHILIGRFSSLSWGLIFSLGYNHRYKNVVSTFPFHRRARLRKIFSQIQDRANSQPILPCKNVLNRNNHYQIIIGNDVWIGRGATILGGVKIGSGAIIGANSTVTKDIPPYAIAAGNPARVIKYRFDQETIKKFMAIKWWNWDVKKIMENAPLMNDVEEFLEKHYTPDLEKVPYEKISPGGGLGYLEFEKYLADGKKIFSFVADFQAPVPLWKRIVSGFCQSKFENSLLVIWTGKDSTPENIKNLIDYIGTFKNDAGQNIFIIPSTKEKIFSPYILKRQTTHFITTREMISLECMDWLWDTNVKIVSALDDGIFDGEPDVNWNKLFS